MLRRKDRLRRRIASLALVVATGFAGSCADPSPPRPPGNESPAPSSPAPFDGRVQCEPGEESGAIHWDYGIPRGTIDDPVAWVRHHAVGFDPTLELSFVDEFRSSTDTLPNLVTAKNSDGLVVAFVEFGRDDAGRYFPNYGEMCASAGIQEFT